MRLSRQVLRNVTSSLFGVDPSRRGVCEGMGMDGLGVELAGLIVRVSWKMSNEWWGACGRSQVVSGKRQVTDPMASPEVLPWITRITRIFSKRIDESRLSCRNFFVAKLSGIQQSVLENQ